MKYSDQPNPRERISNREKLFVDFDPNDVEILRRFGWLHEPSGSGESTADSKPLVSLCVLSYNRLPDLRLTLTLLCHCEPYPNKEIIVVDNGSTDGSVEMVRKEFPQVKVVALPENIVTPARNEFFNHSNGEYLFCFDDDSCPESPDSISNIVSFLQRRKEVAVLTLRFWEPRTQFDGTRDIAKFSARQDSLGLRRTLFIAEGACCFRREHFGESMRYDAQNLWGAEGMDLALSLLKSGRYVYFSEQFSVLHFKHVSGRSSLHGSFWNTKHNLHVLAKHLAWYHLLILLPLHIARRAIDIVCYPGIRMAVVRGVIGSIRDFGFFYRSAKKLTTRQLLDNLPWVWFVIRGGV